MVSLIGSILAVVAIILWTAFPGNIALMYVGLVLFGIFNGLTNPAVWAAVGSYTSLSSFGIVFGIGNSAYNLLSLGLNYFVGYVFQFGTFYVCITWIVVCGLTIAANIVWIVSYIVEKKE